MKKLYYLFSFFVCVQFSAAQTYTVPGAQVQPAWVFPLWFEDGSGAKDTLYFCYDSTAKSVLPYDTILGEVQTIIDTSEFTVYYGCSFNFSTFLIRQSYVTDSNSLGESVCVWHAYLPLKIKWDRNLFYIDSLPYPDQGPAPRAKGGFYFDIPMICIDPGIDCFGTILMTDTIISASCYATDSIVLGGNGFSTFWFGITAWDGMEWLLGVIEGAETQNDWQVYPTLISSSFHIKNNGPPVSSYCVYDLWGRMVKRGEINTFDKVTVETQDWSSGLFLLVISNQHRESSFKLLKP
ncbi:MAG: T9SS type A sorting domain-containing protein [Chitinophagales bacterium]|nr:T9SS type A sorting domain-containing protein [Chitinophagales bacterium]